MPIPDVCGGRGWSSWLVRTERLWADRSVRGSRFQNPSPESETGNFSTEKLLFISCNVPGALFHGTDKQNITFKTL